VSCGFWLDESVQPRGARVPRGNAILCQEVCGARNDVRRRELEWPDIGPECSNFLYKVKRQVTLRSHRDGSKATILANKL